MNAPTMKAISWSDQNAALQQYKEYRHHQSKLSYEQRSAMLGFQALAKGKEILDASIAIKGGGVDDRGRPKLAIARADWERVTCERPSQSGLVFFYDHARGWGASRFKQYRYPSVLPPSRDVVHTSAIVPIIPGKYIPQAPLNHFEILFEADWQAPPVDPLLLRHLAGNLFVVLAKWNLTPLEQAALTTRVL